VEEPAPIIMRQPFEALPPAPVLPEPVPTPVSVPLAPATESGALRSAAVESSANAEPAAVSDERQVRGTLSRYEVAYSRLDAAAAGAVWPSVDRRALARAFGDLASQSVSLGRCDVRINGASAQADCAGVAKWAPKVGGGTHTQARRWHFDLRNTGGDWIITGAAVR
jgi:hypothetical protein